MPPHGGIAGWRNHGVESPDATMGTKGGDGNAGGGAHGADGEPMERSDAEHLAAVMDLHRRPLEIQRAEVELE